MNLLGLFLFFQEITKISKHLASFVKVPPLQRRHFGYEYNDLRRAQPDPREEQGIHDHDLRDRSIYIVDHLSVDLF